MLHAAVSSKARPLKNALPQRPCASASKLNCFHQVLSGSVQSEKRGWLKPDLTSVSGYSRQV